MYVTIYADMLFLVNFIMDAFIFFVSGKALRRRIKVLRVVLGAGASAVLYCIMVLIAPEIGVIKVLAPFILLAAGIAIAFHPLSLREFAHMMLTSYILAFATGGAVLAIYFAINSGITGRAVIEHFSFATLIAATIFFYIILKLISYRLSRNTLSQQQFLNFKIYLNDKHVELSGLLDTGCTLCSPISKTPVILAELNSLRNILPPKIAALYDDSMQDNLDEVVTAFGAENMQSRFQMIPYSAIGTPHGMLVGFNPDFIETADKRVIKNVIIGIANSNVSVAGEYSALVNPAVMRGN